jgi:hypothetical protein
MALILEPKFLATPLGLGFIGLLVGFGVVDRKAAMVPDSFFNLVFRARIEAF